MKQATSATTAVADLSELALSQHVAEGQGASATVVVIRLKDRPGVDHRPCHHQSDFLHWLDQAGQAAALEAGMDATVWLRGARMRGLWGT